MYIFLGLYTVPFWIIWAYLTPEGSSHANHIAVIKKHPSKMKNEKDFLPLSLTNSRRVLKEQTWTQEICLCLQGPPWDSVINDQTPCSMLRLEVDKVCLKATILAGKLSRSLRDTPKDLFWSSECDVGCIVKTWQLWEHIFLNIQGKFQTAKALVTGLKEEKGVNNWGKLSFPVYPQV